MQVFKFYTYCYQKCSPLKKVDTEKIATSFQANNPMRPFYQPDTMYNQPGPQQMWSYNHNPPQPITYMYQNPAQRQRMPGGLNNSKLVLNKMLMNRSMVTQSGYMPAPVSSAELVNCCFRNVF